MNEDTLRQLTQEHLHERMRDARRERLGRELRDAPSRRAGRHWNVALLGHVLAARRHAH